VPYVQDDYLGGIFIDRIKDKERVTNDGDRSHGGFVGEMPGKRKLFKQSRQFLDPPHHRSGGSVTLKSV
jgi:hypothetical protein